VSFWSPNINGAGRAVRILSGFAMLVGAFFLHQQSIAIWPWILGASGVFVLFEGLRGWCVLRACKIRTPL
jgi:hypothetical protein